MTHQQLVKRYLELQSEAWSLGVATPHISTDMTDDEIIRRGKLVVARIEEEQERERKRNDRPQS